MSSVKRVAFTLQPQKATASEIADDPWAGGWVVLWEPKNKSYDWYRGLVSAGRYMRPHMRLWHSERIVQRSFLRRGDLRSAQVPTLPAVEGTGTVGGGEGVGN